MDESWKRYAKKEVIHKKPHFVWFHLYEMPRIGGEWEMTVNRHGVSFGGDENILGLDCSDGRTALWTY